MGDKESGPRGPRCIAMVGPFQSGKTTLLEAILARTGAIQRQGTVEAGTTVGDASKEARHHKMSVELAVATTTFMGDSYTFLDCPGSVEFVHDMRAVLPAIDAAVVVCEADDRKAAQLQLILRELDDDALTSQKDARFSMLETLADHDDELMEQLLADIPPPRDRVFDDLAKELRDGAACPVLMGVATRANGILRLLKALRHEAPGVAATAKRLGVKANGEAVGAVLKTFHTTHGGKLSVARVLNGQIGDGVTLSSPAAEAGRVSGVAKLLGQSTEKRGPAGAGETVAFGKLDSAKTGDTLSSGKQPHPAVAAVQPYPGVLAIAISAKERKDDVKLGLALTKLIEEDPSLTVINNPEAQEMVIWGQGEMHLRVATERLAERFGIAIERRRPTVGYRETIKRPIQQRGRHKKQSGGHGQFGDVVLDIKPMPRNSGFTFEDKITGGVVPRNYIPSVEEGIIDAMKHGPLGFPVVDIAVALVDGSYHAVDSSDMAFRIAGRIGITEALPQCQPVLLEPIHMVEIACPSDTSTKINAILSGRRGQILGFDTREGWKAGTWSAP